MNKETKVLKKVKNFLEVQCTPVDFGLAFNFFLAFFNSTALFLYSITTYAVMKHHQISLIEALSNHPNGINPFSWVINISALLLALFFISSHSSEIRSKTIHRIFYNIKSMFGFKVSYSYILKNKDIIYPLFKNELNRETILVEFLEKMRNKKPIPTSTVKIMLNEIKKNPNLLNKEELGYMKSKQEAQTFFQEDSNQDIEFFVQDKTLINKKQT